MSSQQNIHYFTFAKVIYMALKYLSHKFQQESLQIEYMEDNKFKVHDWFDNSEACLKLQESLNKTLERLNVMKLVQPDKKVERIKMMKKWRKKFEIEGLNVITIKKNYGYSYYLMGLASHEHLYNVLTKLQAHSYKTFQSNFIKFLYKPLIEALVNCKDYQIDVYEKLKVTSTEIRIVELENANKKKGKFLEFLFELKDYVATKVIVERFKDFLLNQFFACGLIFGINEFESTRKMLWELNNNGKISAWRVSIRKKENVSCAYIVLKKFEALDCMTEILTKMSPQRICFLKGVGKSNEFLQPIVSENVDKLTQSHETLKKNYNVKGNGAKTPNEISLTLKDDEEQKNWIPALRILI